MFGWGKRKREMQIVEDVCERIRPQFVIRVYDLLPHRDERQSLAREMMGLASLAALRVMFAPFGFAPAATMQV